MGIKTKIRYYESCKNIFAVIANCSYTSNL